MKKFTTFITLSFLLVFASCNDDNSVEDNQMYNKQFNKPTDVTIVDIASSAGYTELLKAVTYVDSELDAGLAAALSSKQKQVTVFAPNDEAFITLLEVLDSVRDEDISEISDIPAPIVLAVLQYHLTSGRRGSNSVLPDDNEDKTIQTMFNGASFSVDSSGNITDVGGLYSIAIDLPNNSASNGMVHGITGVMLPLGAGEILALWDELEGN